MADALTANNIKDDFLSGGLESGTPLLYVSSESVSPINIYIYIYIFIGESGNNPAMQPMCLPIDRI